MNLKTTAPQEAAPERASGEKSTSLQFSGGLGTMLFKIVALAVLDATAVFAIFLAVAKDAVLIASIIGVITLLINVIYLKRG